MKLARLFKSIGWKLFPYLDLNLKTPLRRYRIPLRSKHTFPTLQEVFLHQCYRPFLERIPQVNSWVDIGCNVGFFSLYAADYYEMNGKRALLIDANPECVKLAREIVNQNQWASSWTIQNAVIGQEGQKVEFIFRQAATRSSLFETKEKGNKKTFICQSLKNILADDNFTSRDLIKIDIEGGEKYLFENESDLLLEFKHGIIEWHAPHWTGRQLQAWAAKHNLELVPLITNNPNIWDDEAGVAFWSKKG